MTYQIDGPAHALAEELNRLVGLNETFEFRAIGGVLNVAAVIALPLGQFSLAPVCGI